MIKKPPVFSIDHLKVFLLEFCHEIFSTASLLSKFVYPIVQSVKLNRQGCPKLKKMRENDKTILPAYTGKKCRFFAINTFLTQKKRFYSSYNMNSFLI